MPWRSLPAASLSQLATFHCVRSSLPAPSPVTIDVPREPAEPEPVTVDVDPALPELRMAAFTDDELIETIR